MSETPKPGETWWVQTGQPDVELRVKVTAVEGGRVFYEYVQTGSASLAAFEAPRARPAPKEAA